MSPVLWFAAGFAVGLCSAGSLAVFLLVKIHIHWSRARTFVLRLTRYHHAVDALLSDLGNADLEANAEDAACQLFAAYRTLPDSPGVRIDPPGSDGRFGVRERCAGRKHKPHGAP